MVEPVCRVHGDIMTLAVWATDHAQSVYICSNTVKTGEAYDTNSK